MMEHYYDILLSKPQIENILRDHFELLLDKD